MTLRCYCCGAEYERGKYRCCAPPANMSSHAWLAKHCKVCTHDPTQLRTHCPTHCTCPKPPRAGYEAFGVFLESATAAQVRPKLQLVKR